MRFNNSLRMRVMPAHTQGRVVVVTAGLERAKRAFQRPRVDAADAGTSPEISSWGAPN